MTLYTNITQCTILGLIKFIQYCLKSVLFELLITLGCLSYLHISFLLKYTKKKNLTNEKCLKKL